MKKCPFCAEEIQTEAIVCKHCHRDLAPPVLLPAQTTKPKPKSSMPWIVLALVVGLGAFYIWSTSAYSVDIGAARSIVAAMESRGEITRRSCNPNSTTMPASVWRSIPNERTKGNLMNALSRICIDDGGKMDMTVIDERGQVLAQFDGRNITR